VVGGARKIHASRAFSEGLVELQDAASQAVVEALALSDGMRVLDLCAGGGGKTLAMAALARLDLFAHDADPGRMRDLPARAVRAGITVHVLTGGQVDAAGPFDLVLADVPCSGSGSWRRAPEAKWALTADRLAALRSAQMAILDRAVRLVAPRGTLVYATCSLLRTENEAQIAAFLDRHPGWSSDVEHRFTPLQGGDGFYTASLTRR
jgi:16S rRNA (cytosine967-C5)-methyltransferase